MENTIINSFEGIPYLQSAEIYRLFSQGKVLNKQRYDDVHGCFVDDGLFTLVFNKIKHFTLFFKHMGYELKFDDEGDFYFTQEIRDSNNDESDDNAMKIQAVLLFIGRYYAKVGDLEQLSNPMFGLKETDIDSLKQDELLISSLRTLCFEGINFSAFEKSVCAHFFCHFFDEFSKAFSSALVFSQISLTPLNSNIVPPVLARVIRQSSICENILNFSDIIFKSFRIKLLFI